MSDENLVDLEPVAAKRAARKQREALADAIVEREQKQRAQTDPIAALAEALRSIQGTPQPQAGAVQYGEDDQSEVWLIANQRFHVDARCLAYSQIAGTAFGMDGMSRKVAPGDRFAVRERYANAFLANGSARAAS